MDVTDNSLLAHLLPHGILLQEGTHQDGMLILTLDTLSHIFMLSGFEFGLLCGAAPKALKEKTTYRRVNTLLFSLQNPDPVEPKANIHNIRKFSFYLI